MKKETKNKEAVKTDTMNSTEQVETVKAAMEEGQKPKVIILRYAREWGISGRTVVRRMRLAKKMILAEGERKKEIYEKVRDRRFEEAAKKEMMSLEEADAYLAAIVSGMATAKKVVNSKNGVEIIEVPVDPQTRLRALSLLYKRRGAFPRMKTKQEEEEENEPPVKTGWVVMQPVPPVEEEEQMGGQTVRCNDFQSSAPEPAMADNVNLQERGGPVVTKEGKEVYGTAERFVNPETKNQPSAPSYTINPLNGEKIRTKVVYPPPPFFPYKHGYKPPYSKGDDKGYVHFKTRKKDNAS